MATRNLASEIIAAALAAACAPNPPTAVAPPTPPPQVQAAPPAPLIAPVTLEGYKKLVASRIAISSGAVFEEPLPDMLKSVVVLDITIDRDGNLARVAVRRSNGYQALDARALDSVRRAAPFAAPTWLARHGEGSVNFLETFLFRDDGRFQILSLAAAR